MGVALILSAATLGMAQERERGERGARRGPPPADTDSGAEAATPTVAQEVPVAPPQQDDSLTLLERFVSEKEQQPILYTVRCKYISAETLRRLIENFLTPIGTVACSEEDDLLTVSDTEERIGQIKALIAEADQPVPQVLVEARIVEFEITDALTKEIDIGFATMGDSDSLRKVFKGLILPMRNTATDPNDANVADMSAGGFGSSGRIWAFAGNDSFKIWGLLNYLETKNCARLLSSPNIVIRRGADGNIVTGEKVPISTETITGNSISTSTRYENVGVKLIVRPIMIAEDRIRLRINPEFSNISRYEITTTGGRVPYIAQRSATTELEAKSGEMIVIGGLLRKEERVTQYRVPYLASIPVLGWFFRGTSSQSVTSQLVIFMTPYLITPDNAEQREHGQLGGIPDDLRDKIHILEDNMTDRQANPIWKGDIK